MCRSNPIIQGCILNLAHGAVLGDVTLVCLLFDSNLMDWAIVVHNHLFGAHAMANTQMVSLRGIPHMSYNKPYR